MPLGLLDVFTERILLYSEVECRTARGGAETEVCVSSFGSGEEHEMGDAKRSAHGDIVAKSVGLSLLEACCGTGLHDTSDVGYKLTDTRANFAGTDTDDHALGVFHIGSGIEGTLDRVVCARVGSLLGSPFGHVCDWVLLSGVNWGGEVEFGAQKDGGGDFWLCSPRKMHGIQWEQSMAW